MKALSSCFPVLLFTLILAAPSKAADPSLDKFARKVASYELPAPGPIDVLLVEAKEKSEWTLLIRLDRVVKRSVVACDSNEHVVQGKSKFGEGCNLQVGRIIEPIFPSKGNKERLLYVAEIGDSLYIVDGTLDNYLIDAFKILKSTVVNVELKPKGK